jgi:acyl carrier protein
LDRKKLPAPVLEDIQTTTYRAPRNEVECTLCEIWQEVIGAETVGIDDNYFELGGNSIGTVQIVFAAENKGISLRIGDIMRYPTIANLSEILNKDNDTHATKRQRNTDPKSKVVGAGKSITTDLNKLSKLNANDMCWSTVVKLDDMTTETHIRHKVKNLLKTDKALTLSMDPSDNLHSEKAESFVLNEHYLPVNRQLVKSVLQLFDHQPNNSQLNEHIDNIVSALVEIVLKESGPLIRIAWTHDSHGCVYLIVVVHKLLKTDLEWQLFKEYLGGNQLVFPLPTE